MTDKPSIVALIPARSGSKRLPHKNVRRLAGHLLLAYTIAAAQDSQIFDATQGAPRPPHFQPGSVLPSEQSPQLARLKFEQLQRTGYTARRTPNPTVSPLYENDLVSSDEINWRVQRRGQVLDGQIRPSAPARFLVWSRPR